MKYDRVVFDVDGTLWNACATTAKGINNALERLGIPERLTAKDIKEYSGEPCSEFSQRLPDSLSVDSEALSEIDKGERAAIRTEGGLLYDGVRSGLQKISEEANVSLVSNCQDWYIEEFINFADIRKLLSGYDSHGASGVSKAEMLSRIVSGGSTVYIGDTSRDMQAAKTANMDFVGASYGFGDVTGAEVSVKSFEEVLSYLMQ